ncbi:MAG: hypothetical protein HY741_24375 [Chloroflexi bacterium]|nr:hypothetical protein [Chloroflexota bacterium]
MNAQWIRAGAIGAFVAAGFLVVQFAIGSTLGSDLILLESSFDVARVAAFLQAHAATLTQLMVADDLFVIGYSVSFVGIALYLAPRNRLLALVGLGLALLTSATDFTENSLTIALTRLATQGATLQADWLLVLQILGQLKYLWIFAGGTLSAIGIWNERRMNRAVAILFWLFPLVGAFAMLNVTGALLRIFWMLVLLLAGGIFLWRESGQRIKSG